MTNTMVSKLDLQDVFSAVSLCLREMVPQEYASLMRPPPCLGFS